MKRFEIDSEGGIQTPQIEKLPVFERVRNSLRNASDALLHSLMVQMGPKEQKPTPPHEQ